MKYQYSILTVVAALLLAVPVFPQAAAPAAKPVAAAKAPETEPPPVLAVPQGYSYASAGRRDPFLNPIPKPEQQETAEAVRPPGLPGLLLAEIKLSGVVVSVVPGMTKAVITGPGRKMYFARRGDSLFDAVIKEIRTDSVVFSVVSPKTKKPTDTEVVRSVSTPSGENK